MRCSEARPGVNYLLPWERDIGIACGLAVDSLVVAHYRHRDIDSTRAAISNRNESCATYLHYITIRYILTRLE